MKTATVADLRNNFATISKWIQAGEAVTITKYGLSFATLLPVESPTNPPAVDRLARLRKIFPAGAIKSDSAEVIKYDRGET